MASVQYEFEDMEINDSIIMSLLEESSLDDDISEDEEQLNRVMRSLEAEINTTSLDCPNVEETDRSRFEKQVEGCEFPEPRDRFDDFGLVDAMLSLQSDDDMMMSWYSVSCMDGADGNNVREIGGFDGYSQMNYEVAFEEQQFCYELWQDQTNDVIFV
ncbi:PREDICTED: uncharacterized protein LOC104822599 [Tarenaya hassleriana]|uniref:uncharacterized protein LOC104822599 n=1 Tax=Tarenaya hassleriana TaxID=28532 RepID=UPI00053C254F|nr:PREDICTED: uncharacterized protein LOC104822599 [Tarenaya hassleriana]